MAKKKIVPSQPTAEEASVSHAVKSAAELFKTGKHKTAHKGK